MIALFRKNAPFFWPYLLFLLLGGVLQWRYSQAEIFLFVNTHYHAWADYLFAYGTHLGDGLFYAAVVLLLLFVRFQYAITALVAFLLSGLTGPTAQAAGLRGRPAAQGFFEKSGQVLHWVDGVEVHLYNSFPSGHATTAFSVCCLLSLLVGAKAAKAGAGCGLRWPWGRAIRGCTWGSTFSATSLPAPSSAWGPRWRVTCSSTGCGDATRGSGTRATCGAGAWPTGLPRDRFQPG
jgi:hypothetical protein